MQLSVYIFTSRSTFFVTTTLRESVIGVPIVDYLKKRFNKMKGISDKAWTESMGIFEIIKS
jgi:hypothetical protein